MGILYTTLSDAFRMAIFDVVMYIVYWHWSVLINSILYHVLSVLFDQQDKYDDQVVNIQS